LGRPDGRDTRSERLADELLVLRCQEGDITAFSDLVRRWQEPLWRYARNLTNEDDAAWEVVQETWFAVAKGLPKLQDAACFPAWCYQILSHKARDWIRRESRRRKAHQGYQADHPGPATDPPAQAGQSLDEVLKGLPADMREILLLRYDRDFNTAEIADILAIPEGTVKSRLFYARNQIRQVYRRNDDG
jgi:RNA polymerase sigma-70 factor, ECF subfamily